MTTQTQRQTTTVELDAPPDLLDKVLEATAAKLDGIATRYSVAVADPAMGRLRRTLVMAQGVQQLRAALDGKVMKQIMALMNTPLGFMTDRGPHAYKAEHKTPYNEDVVRECVIAGLMNGVYPVNNEMNIISGRCYIAQEGYRRKVREIPGLTDLKLAPGLPRVDQGKTVIRFGATWKLNGNADSLRDAEGKPGIVLEIPTNQYTGPDAVVGKAIRKGLKRIWEQVYGSDHTAPEDGEVGEMPAPSKTDQVIEQLKERLPAKPNGKPAGPRPDQLERLRVLSQPLSDDETLAHLGKYGVADVTALTPEQADELIATLTPAREPGSDDE